MVFGEVKGWKGITVSSGKSGRMRKLGAVVKPCAWQKAVAAEFMKLRWRV